MLRGSELLDKTSILSIIQPLQLKKLDSLELHDTLSSTNDYLLGKVDKVKANIPENEFHPSSTHHQHLNNTIACFAEAQTQGRGQQGKTWISPHARNLYLSLLCHFEKDVTLLSGLSLSIAVVITRALKKFGIDEGISIKWPNDVFYKNHKLAGILIELRPQMTGKSTAVIGVGLNVHMPETDGKIIDQPWTDLFSILGLKIDRNKLAGMILDELIHATSIFKESGFASFQADWHERDLYYGKEISFVTASGTFDGLGRGINEEGQYLLESNGNIHPFSSGKLSLKKC